jgi:hypothetical protein
MISLKRVSLFLVVSVVASMLAFLVTTFSEDRPSARANLKVRVLRLKDQGHLKPTQTEVAIAKGQSKEERSLEDKIPKHLPIKVKIRSEKEKAFKDIDNPGWARDFELEVTNTGTRPIYRLVLLLHLPEAAINSGRLVFPLTYGRRELTMFQDTLESAKPDDVPIEPGATYILRIPAGGKGWERPQLEKGWPQPKKLLIKFVELSFGDGTGFRWGEGASWPPRKKASRSGCRPGLGSRSAKAHHLQPQDGDSRTRYSLESTPASFLPARFWSLATSANSLSSKPEPEPKPDCCPSGCQWVREYNSPTACYGTIGCDEIHRVDVEPCSQPRSCRNVRWLSQSCIVYQDGYDYVHLCEYAETSDCGSSPLSGGAGGGGGGGGAGGGGNEGGSPYPCTEYYWYWFVSYDGGQTWELSGQVDFAGCW